MRIRYLLWTTLGATALAAAPAAPADAGPTAGGDGGAAAELVWNRRNAEHLLNRAGFGARQADIERAVRLGAEAFVERLLAGIGEEPEPYYAERLSGRDGGRAAMKARMEMSDQMLEEGTEEMQRAANALRQEDRLQLLDYSALWIQRMVQGEDPLRDRMTLFWHGYFTSSMEDVKSSYNMIRQHELLRSNALGSFEVLLRGIARDPAMLEYLDSRSNKKSSPNENFARELMELFTLGEGNYTEHDVKEAARAFTGWADRSGEYWFRRGQHDSGMKEILGHSGRYDGDNVLDILLEHEACPRWVAGRMLAYFEGVEPGAARRERYATRLREVDWDLSAFLRTLFLDPEFYRDEIVGRRIASPVDFLVGAVRRLNMPVPPLMLQGGARVLGEHLFFPPNVKGWDGGETWITTSTFMMRGNLAGVLLGQISPEALFRPEEGAGSADDALSGMAADVAMGDGAGTAMGAMEEASELARGQAATGPAARQVGRAMSAWRPRLNLTARLRLAGLATDAELVDRLLDELLAVEASPETRAWLLAHVAAQRHARAIEVERLTDGGDEAERLLRELAHLILSQPEAQLN